MADVTTIKVNRSFYAKLAMIEDFSLGARRRAGKAGAKAALACMKKNAPVRTGRLRDSWQFGSAKGYTIDHNTITIHLQNPAHEVRRRNPEHYYMIYPEFGFYHIWQQKYHPGRHDLNKATLAALQAIIDSLNKDAAAMKNGGKKGGKK